MTVRVRICNGNPAAHENWDTIPGASAIKVEAAHLVIETTDDSDGRTAAIYPPGAWFSAEVVESAKRG